MELALDAQATLAEAPTWSPCDGALYWIDIRAPTLNRFAPTSGATRTWRMPCDIGAFALTPDARTAIVALRDGLYTLDLAGEALTQIAPAPFDPALHRFNEGACDARGRFWVGTMFDPVGENAGPPQRASLHRYTPSEGLIAQPDAAELHNGMAWSPDGRTFYLSHTQRETIFAFAFDPASGRIDGKRVFATVPKANGVPDGAAVDEEGGYWCALHGGGRVRRYRSDGSIDRDVALPVSQPTMCAFAGPDLDTLYVTSASEGLSREARAKEPHAGGIFRLKPGVRGVARAFFKP